MRGKRVNPRRACMKRLMTVNEAIKVWRDRSVWRFILSAYPLGIKCEARLDYIKYLCQASFIKINKIKKKIQTECS